MIKDDLESLFLIRGKLFIINQELFYTLKKEGFEKELKKSNLRNCLLTIPYAKGKKKMVLWMQIRFIFFYFVQVYPLLTHHAFVFLSHPIFEYSAAESVLFKKVLKAFKVVTRDKRKVFSYFEI